MFHRLQHLLGKSSDIYSEPGRTSHHPTFSRYIEYCWHIWGATAPITLSILDAVQRRAIRLIGNLPPPAAFSPACCIGDLSHFYGYSNGFCSSELTPIIPPLSKPARCNRETSSSHPRAVVLHTSRTERYDRTFAPRVSTCPGPGMDCLVMYLLSQRLLAYSSPASTNFP
nr:unnamed protein product [Callosobruchus chinensis]